MDNLTDFKDLGLSEQMLRAVSTKGFETPTAIQRLTIPRLLDGTNDLIAQSQTGTGKTAAFGLPIMQQIEPHCGHIAALVLVPTRELALQVSQELLSYNSEKMLSIASIYGGASMSEQLRRIGRGIDIVVGTPGRILDHLRRGTIDLSQVRFMVLDEADEMLNMGFVEDVEEILSKVNERRRVMLFSATMPERIVKLSHGYMRETEILRVESQQITTDLTDQIYFEVRESDKLDALTRIIDITSDFYGIVFSRTKVGVDELTARLTERGYAVEGLHGDVSQAQREKILKRFRDRGINILVATDVAARGIDIANLTHVINYSLPQDSESYVHRIGRTGRAGNQGTAVTFISPGEFRQFGYLKKDIKVDIKQEQLPSPQDIVAIKRNKIKNDLQEIIENGNVGDYSDITNEILSAYTPEQAFGALLRLAFRSELDESRYPEIRSFSVDRKGTARLFIAIGRMDGYDVRKLVDLLKRECGLKDNKINDVHLSDTYSFVSVPFADAEHVVRKLNQLRGHKGRNGNLAEIARPEDDSRPRKERSARPKRSNNGATPHTSDTDENGADNRSPRKNAEKRPVERKSRPARETSTARAASESDFKTIFDDNSDLQAANDGFDWSIFDKGDKSWSKPERSIRHNGPATSKSGPATARTARSAAKPPRRK